MNLVLPRIGIATLVAIALAACSGQSTVPSAAPQSIAPAITTAHLPLDSASFDALSANAKSPCDIKGFWYFKGSCIKAPIPSAGAKATLPAYKGLSLKLTVGKSNADNDEFLIGEGTSSADITGTFENTKFPNYGDVPCVTPKGKTTTCIGKAFLYVLLANAGKTTVAFPGGLPLASVTTTGTFPGTKKCAVNGIGFQNNVPAGWFVLSDTSKPKGKTVSFPSVEPGFSFAANNFTVLAFTCE